MFKNTMRPIEFHYLQDRNMTKRLDELLGQPRVGLYFEGKPTDKIKFIHVLESFSFPSIVARQIMESLVFEKYQIITVRRELNFLEIEAQMLQLGVKISLGKSIKSIKTNNAIQN